MPAPELILIADGMAQHGRHHLGDGEGLVWNHMAEERIRNRRAVAVSGEKTLKAFGCAVVLITIVPSQGIRCVLGGLAGGRRFPLAGATDEMVFDRFVESLADRSPTDSRRLDQFAV